MVQRDFEIPTDTTILSAHLTLPDRARGLVVFVHGAYEGRDLESDRALSSFLAGTDLGVLTVELLFGVNGHDHVDDRQRRHAMHVLTQRLVATCDWVRESRTTASLPIGLFGVDIGAGAALAAAVARPKDVACIVSWDGRADLVGTDLITRVRAPTLFVVTDRDPELKRCADASAALLRVERGVKSVARARTVDDRVRVLEQVATAARGWFGQFFRADAAATFKSEGVRPG